MKTTIHTLAVVAVLLLLASPTWAQVAINNTTLTAAMTVDQKFVQVAAVTCTGCVIDGNAVVFVDSEAMCVNSSYVSGLTLPVTRGCLGTKAAAHGINLATSISLNVVFIGPAKRFNDGDPPVGQCTRTSLAFLPWINVRNGAVWTCDTGWRALYNFMINATAPSRPTSY